MRRVCIIVLTVAVLLPLLVAAPMGANSDPPPVFVPLVCANMPFSPPGLAITMLRWDTSDECVTITNLGASDVSLAGHRLESVPEQWYDLPEIALAPGASVRIHSGPDGFDKPPSDLLWTTRYMWDNTGDTARLYDPDGRLLDVWVY